MEYTEAHDRAFADAVKRAWEKWPSIKDTVPDYGFSDWCKRVGGFAYTARVDDSYRRVAVLTEILDEAKYAWFMLKWS